jgi:hypothetical protein
MQLSVLAVNPHITSSFQLNIPPEFCPNLVLPSSWYISSSTITSFTFDIIFTAEDDYDIDYSTVTGGRYRLRMGPCAGHQHPVPDAGYDQPQLWEVECLGEFTFPSDYEEKGVLVTSGSRSNHPLTGLDDDSYVTTIAIFTGLGLRKRPEVFKAAIYSVLPSLNVEGNSPSAGERQAGTAEVTVLQNDSIDPIYVCPVSGRVTWAAHQWFGEITVDRYLE